MRPMFIWIMEPYKNWNAPKDYHCIHTQNFYKNILFIRNYILNGRTISRNQFGIKVDEISFRYIPSQTAKTKITRWRL